MGSNKRLVRHKQRSMSKRLKGCKGPMSAEQKVERKKASEAQREASKVLNKK